MKAKELVGYLRAETKWQSHGSLDDLADSAADLIEAQAKAIEELRDAVSHWMVADPKSFLNYTMNDVGREALTSYSKEGEQG